ncbi:MAG: recombinase [Parvibaculum sp.]|nr:recombinase [Parvibaculum sp.]|tara:strand:- start:466 stop:858 length:393 start_codon:yes stop_codon:yes gene_type:complete
MRRKLIKKIDRIFSKYVRLKNADHKGYCTCITCGKKHIWDSGQIHAGHFVSRRFLVTRFDERNVYPQCAYCNNWLAGNQYMFGKAIDNIHGEGTADKLMILSKKTIKIENYELDEIFCTVKKDLLTLSNK